MLVALFVFQNYSEGITQTTTYNLPESLVEISGMEFLNDSTLVAINDGGNEAVLYLMNTEGELIKTVKIENASNKDWEDLASDGEHLYIADVGNNFSKRKKLKIYKVDIDDLLTKDEVTAEKITFSYGDQEAFPPGKDSLYYDSEGIVYKNDSLWIFTKTKADPWDGIAFVYKVPALKGKYTLVKQHEIHIGDDGWWADAITAADLYGDKFYLTTYDRLIVGTFEGEEFKQEKSIYFDNLTQKESVLVKDNKTVFISDEKHNILGGGKLYKMILND